jgi:hypothetical protein
MIYWLLKHINFTSSTQTGNADRNYIVTKMNRKQKTFEMNLIWRDVVRVLGFEFLQKYFRLT